MTDCPTCRQRATQVASLAHTAAELRAELSGCRDNAREMHRENTAETNALEASRDHYRACTRNLQRRLRLARWAGAVAADTRGRCTRVLLTGVARVQAGLAIDAMRERDRYRRVVEDGVAELARSWRAT